MPGGGWAMRHRCALLVGSVLAAPWQCACTESPAASQCSNEGQEVPVCHEIVNYLNELQSLGFATAVCQGNENCTGFVFESVDGGAPQSMSDMGKLYLLDCAPNPNVTHHSWTNRSFWRCSVHTSGCPGLVNFLGGDAQHFEISQEGAFSRVVPALERAESASDFYDYRSSSSHTGLEHVDRSLMYLYRDLSNPEQNLALFWTHGIKDSRQASAQLWGRMKGMPPGTKIIVQDDAPAEFNWHDHWNWTDGWEKGSLSGSGPYIGGKWTFAKNTDGGAIDSMRTDLNWTIEVDVQFHSGAPDWDWRIYFGDGSEQELDPSKTLVIGYVATANKSADTGPGVTALQVGQDTTFCALPTVTSHSASVLVTFDFGDGTSRDVWVPPGELACAHHSYEKPGSYPVTANATDVRCGGPSYAKQLTTAVVTDASAPPPPPPGPPPSPPPPPPLPPPSYSPTMSPSAGTAPSSAPSSPPSTHPTAAPLPSPSSLPTKPPSSAPSAGPSPAPSTAPSAAPTGNPTPPVSSPSRSPRIYPTAAPQQPSAAPSHSPTTAPAALPTRSPVSGAAPTAEPTAAPAAPTGPPAGRPTKAPAGAVGNPTAAPAGNPTAAPTGNPTAAPAGSLTAAPAGNSTTGGPTAAPVSGPMPSAGPRPSPTSAPAEQQNTTPPSQGPAPAPSPPSAEPAANGTTVAPSQATAAPSKPDSPPIDDDAQSPQAMVDAACARTCCSFDCGKLPSMPDPELRLCPGGNPSECTADWCCAEATTDNGSDILPIILAAAGAVALCAVLVAAVIRNRRSSSARGRTKGKRITGLEMDQHDLAELAGEMDEMDGKEKATHATMSRGKGAAPYQTLSNQSDSATFPRQQSSTIVSPGRVPSTTSPPRRKASTNAKQDAGGGDSDDSVAD